MYPTRLSLVTRCDTILAMGCAYAQLKQIEVYTTSVWEDKMNRIMSMNGKETTRAVEQIRLIDDYRVRDFIRPLTDKDIRTIITQKSWSRIKTVEGAVRKFRKQAIKISKAEGVDTMPKQEEKVQDAVEAPVKEKKRTTYTRQPKVETPAEKVVNWDGKKYAKQVQKNVTSTGNMINEMERVAKESMIHYLNVSQDPDLELIDIDKFKTLITLESPKNSAGTHKKDSITRGHFTKTDEWTDSKGVTYRAINLNPYLLESMGVDGLIGTIYHETIHAFADWKDVSDVGKNGKHNKKFEEFANASGIIEATKVEDYRGFETGLTKEGKKWAKDLKFNTKLFFKTLPEPKEKEAPKPKRGNLECSECGFEVSLPLGKYVSQLSKVVENLPAEARRLDIDGIPFTLKDYSVELPVINCIADGNGLMPIEKHIAWFQLQCDLEEAKDEGDEE